MNPDFQILLDFLGRCGPEVSGRGFTTPSSEAAIRLQRFAVGDADDAERAESEWLLARENDPGAPAPTSMLASDYTELESLLGTSPPGSADESWHDEVLKLAAPPAIPLRPRSRRPVYRWAMGGTLIVAAAVAVLMLRPRPRADELEIAIRHGDQVRGDPSEAVVGDRLIVRARAGGPSDLRVYRDNGTLVARCPDGPGCITPVQDEHAIDITLDAPVQYYVILVVGKTDLPAATMDAYLDAARAANVRIVTHEPINVH